MGSVFFKSCSVLGLTPVCWSLSYTTVTSIFFASYTFVSAGNTDTKFKFFISTSGRAGSGTWSSLISTELSFRILDTTTYFLKAIGMILMWLSGLTQLLSAKNESSISSIFSSLYSNGFFSKAISSSFLFLSSSSRSCCSRFFFFSPSKSMLSFIYKPSNKSETAKTHTNTEITES